MSLCCKTKINAPFSYDVPKKDMKKSEILPHSPVAKHGYVPPKGNLAGVFSIHALQAESIFPVAHNEEKVKRISLCFICSYVEMDVSMLRHEKTHFLRNKKRTINSFTYPLVNLPIRPLANWLTCQLLSLATG